LVLNANPFGWCFSSYIRQLKQGFLCSDDFYAKNRHPPVFLLLLSKSNPLRWASIWFCAGTSQTPNGCLFLLSIDLAKRLKPLIFL